MIEICNSISDWMFNLLEKDFSSNNISNLTTAYVSSLMEEKSTKDISNISIVDLYNLSIEKKDFINYQNLADTCLFREIINYKNNKFSNLQIIFGKNGYYTCYQFSLQRLEFYKELYHNFELISNITKESLDKVKYASFYFLKEQDRFQQ